MSTGNQEVVEALRTTLKERDRLRRENQLLRASASEPIAIVGMACRFPGGVASPADLWELLAEGRDAITEFPADRGWEVERIYNPDPENPGTTYTKQGGFLADAAEFDAEFFAISPREALIMDPQERLLLESCWEALEDAGIDPASLKKSPTGVFAGVAFQNYGEAAGATSSIVSGRVSYTLGLEGPAITINTACSSSLVAMHLAAQALRQGECTLALAGGVTVHSTPGLFVAFSSQRALSPDGRCRAFDEGADGTSWAEGVGVVALERLSDAKRNGHTVLAVMRGSAVNQDGASNGLTAPNGPSQERVIRQALAGAGLEARDIDAVEAHGTGTTLGDPIEAGALLATYGQDREKPVLLGSIKSNIGHTQAAAGVAGVIKMTEAMRRGVLPKTLHVDVPSSKVDWEAGEIELLTEQQEWGSEGESRRAGVSSFGISGTNAHVILEEAPQRAYQDSGAPFAPIEGKRCTGAAERRLSGPIALVLSAKAEPALADAAERLATHLQDNPELDLTDVAYSLVTTRSAMEHRAVALGSDREELLASLASITPAKARQGKLAYLLTGQGSQRLGMGKELYESDQGFKEAFDAVCAELDQHLSDIDHTPGGSMSDTQTSLKEIVFAKGKKAAAKLEDTTYAQPALFAIEVALYEALAQRGLKPDLLAGHSVGEVAAAHIAGVLDLADAAKLIVARGRLMGALPAGGAMAAIEASEDEIAESIEGKEQDLAIAAINGPGATVISGEEDAVEGIRAQWEERGRKTKRLAVSHAFHSPLMEPMLEQFAEVAGQLSFNEPRIPIVSNVTGELLSAEQATDPAYWVRHAREAVRFADSVETLAALGATTYLELGPDPVLCAMARECLGEEAEVGFVPTLRENRAEAGTITTAIANAQVAGAKVEWGTFFAGTNAKRVPLPTYSFQRKRYWIAPPQSTGDASAIGQLAAGHPLLAAAIADPEDGGLTLTGRLSLAGHPWLADHVVSGAVILPGTAFLELALRAAAGVGAATVEELTLQAPLVFPPSGAVAIQVVVSGREENGHREVAIHSLAETGEDELSDSSAWTCHAQGILSEEPGAEPERLDAWPPADAEPLDVDHLYDLLAEGGLEYGPAFQGLIAAWRDGDRIYAEASLSEAQAEQAGSFAIHPALLDAALHGIALTATEGFQESKLPFSWSQVSLRGAGASELRIRIAPEGEKVVLAVADGTGAPLATVGALALRPLEAAQLRSPARGGDGLLGLEWAEVSIAAQDSQPEGVELLHCEVEEAAAAPAAARSAARAVLDQIQRWIADESQADSRLALVTSGAMAVSEDEAPDPAAAAIWGLIRSAQSEHPGRFTLIDSDDSEASRAALAGALVAGAEEPQLALRAGKAFVPRLARPAASAEEAGVSIDRERTVLVSGATGGLGALVARHLVEEHGARHLLLVSRSGPEAEGAGELTSELEGLGAEATVAACDVADAEALAALLAAVPAEHPLGAVVHCAGVIDDGTIESLADEQIDRVFAAKVDAAWNLHELSADADLSAFVLFSAAAGTLGSPGQANYAAANVFLDALATRRRREGLPATSIAWGLWERQSGMTSQLGEADLARMRRGGIEALSDEQGLQLFDAALRGESATAVAVPLNLAGLRGLASVGALPPIFSGLVRVPRRAAASGSLATTLAGLPEEEHADHVLDLVRREVAGVLGHASAGEVDPKRAFQELGFDSLAAVELRNRLSAVAGLRLSATVVFDHPNSAALAEHILAEATSNGAADQVAVRAQASEEPIAIVGMACRYPGDVSSPEQLWKLVAQGRDGISEFPGDRGWDVERLYDPDPGNDGTSYTKEGGFIVAPGEFDAEFFGISPREALVTDPQQRLLLESCWEALEDAGIDPSTLAKTQTGVFAGVMYQDYGPMPGMTSSIVSGRIAYTLGLEGPAISVDTACSSSLVAMHLASQALHQGECTLALAGGVTVLSTPGVFVEFSRQRGLAPDGRSKSFAEAADGVGWAEGVGVLVLERLSDARRNGHEVLATIKGSAVNQDGASNGLTAPNGPSQERVIRQALANARLQPEDVDVVEAHGTGTTLGDPIEAGALLGTYGKERQRPLKLGSIKSNIGHTQAAAGVAGVIKMTEAMRRGVLPKTLHVDAPSSKVDWEAGEIELLTEALEWTGNGRPRRAGISSFGVSGTNAHVILEEATPADPDATSRDPDRTLPSRIPLTLSTKTAPALAQAAERLAAHLREHQDLDPEDVAYSLATTRPDFEHRAVALGGDREELLTALAALSRGEEHGDLVRGRARATHRPIFLFPGQGAQARGMAVDLLDASPAFADHMRACEEALAPHVEWSLAEVLRDPEARWLDRLDVVQPALFAVMVSLAKLWRESGVRPEAVIGHSQGEIAAAHIAGGLSLEDAALVVAERGKAMAKIAGEGGMLSVSLAPEELGGYTQSLGDRVSLAAINGPRSLVVSGDQGALEEIRTACEENGVRARRIAVDYAAHSPQIESLKEELLEAFAPISPRSGEVPLVSTVSGSQIDIAELGPEYWYRNLRQTVLLEPVLRAQLEEGKRAFIEISPHPVLAFGVGETIDDTLPQPEEAILLSTLRKEEDDVARFSASLAEAHASGIAVDWQAFFAGAGVERVPLPTYPFQRRRYWLTATAAGADPGSVGLNAAGHPLLGASIEDPAGEGLTLAGRISLATHPWLADHALGGVALLPATAFLELALRAGSEVGAETVEELTMLAPLAIPEAGAVALRVAVLPPGSEGEREVAIHSRFDGEGGQWTQNASGTLSSRAPTTPESLDAWPPPDAEPVEVEYLYERLAEFGLEYGPAFQGLGTVWAGGERVYAEVSLPEAAAYDAAAFGIHPALLDAALQAALPVKLSEDGAPGGLPFAWKGVALLAEGTREARVCLTTEGEAVTLSIADAEGTPVATVESLAFRALDSSPAAAVRNRRGLLGIDWVAVPLGEEAEQPAEVELVRCEIPDGPSAEAARGAAKETLETVQKWLAADPEGGSRLALLTKGAVAAAEGESPDPAAAVIWGLVRSAQSEHPGRLALIDSDGSEASEAAISAALATPEPQVALRDGVAMAPRLVRVEPAELDNGLVIDPERTVLITGADGGVAPLLAGHLEEHHGVRHLLLCDAPDRQGLEELLGSIDPEHPLGAVIHCAAELADGLVESLDGEGIDRVFQPKADLAWDLHELTAGEDLSAFILFSSMAGTLGSPGQANYAAANSFLDSLAQLRQARELPATAIAWGLWEHQVALSGMSEADLARMRRGGIEALSDEQGMAMLDAALGLDRATVLALRLDLRSLGELASGGALPPIFSGLVRGRRRRSAAAGSLGAKLATLPEAEAEGFVLDLVRDEVAAVLGHASGQEIEPERAFQELGFDSLGAVELRNRLSEAAGVRLRATVVFDYPSATALAEHLHAEATANGAAKQVVVRAQASEEPIAIVGMACRYPGGVASPDGLWRLVAEGRDGITEFPSDRGWELERIYHPEPGNPGTSYAREGGFLAEAAEFDAEFFGISPREALVMDPQERVLLESSWEALEAAGIDPASLRRTRTGVFAGVAYQDYGQSSVNTSAIVSGRVSYTLGLEGPAMTVNTACSSSLVAMHLAAQALRQGECTLALAGGVTTLATPEVFIDFSLQRGLAPDGRSKSFADAADGAGFSEGVGVLALERLSDAQRAGRPILAVLRGSAVNQDGASNGLTAPNGPSQERVIRQALANAGLQSKDVDVVEAHGTGTTLGDPIEAGALLATYGQERERPLKLGSLKSNIGHTQAAAGVGGVIKMVMAMREGVMPKTLHVDRPTTQVEWEAGEIELLTEPEAWERNGAARRAGVSSFGISGTNAHVIVEEPPVAELSAEESSASLKVIPFVLSAKSEPALADAAEQLAAHLRQNPELELGDVAYSLATARPALEQRAVALGSDREELLSALATLTPTRARSGKLAYLFSGQGSQRLGMGRELYGSDPAYADAFDRACEQLDPELGESLAAVIFAEGATAAERLQDTAFAQPALFATEVALYRALASKGTVPDLLAGHSIGELVAAHVAGVLSLADAARLVCARGRLMGALPPGGAMLALAASEEEAARSIEGKEAEVSIAAVNSLTSVVLSGAGEAIDALAAEWEAEGRRTKRLAVSHAFHSPLIEPMLDEFAAVAGSIEFGEPRIPIVSNRSGEVLDPVEAQDPAYWVAHVREPVRFAAAVSTLWKQGARTFVEVGPDPVLCPMAQETLEGEGEDAGAPIPTLREGRPEPEALAAGLAEAYARGAKIEWGAFFKGTGAKRVPLPTYPFQRQRYWLPPAPTAADVGAAGLSDPGHPLLGAAIEDPGGGGITLTGRLSLATQPWLAEHSLHGAPVLPGAAFLELALHAAERVGAAGVAELTVEAPLLVPERGAVLLQVSVAAAGEDGRREISIHSRVEGGEGELGGDADWVLNAAGRLSAESPAQLEPLGEWPPPGAEPLELDALYDGLADRGLEYGGALQEQGAAWRLGDELFAEVSLGEARVDEAGRYGIHPLLLELAQTTGRLLDEEEELQLPSSWREVRLDAAGAGELRLRVEKEGDAASFAFWDRNGAPLARIGALRERSFSAAELGAKPRQDTLFEVAWTPLALDGQDEMPEAVEVLRPTDSEDNGVEGARAAVARVLAEIQRWLADEDKAGLRLAFVTEGGVAVGGSESPDLAAAAIWGLVRSAQSEHPDRFLLIDSDRSEASAVALAAALAQTEEAQLALRDGVALVPRLARMSAANPDEAPGTLDPDRTVFLSGATGGLGPLIARHLVVAHGARHLLLASRSGAEADGVEELRAELEALGAEVTFAACDVSRREALRELLDAIPAAHPLGAVVHAAGTLADATVEGLGEEELQRVFAPKADAAWHLHELTQEFELSAFVLFSSAVATLGGPGQANYAAANAFLDALAEQRRAEGLAATSIAWGAWAAEGGMAGRLAEADLKRMERGGMLALTEGQGLAALDAALASGRPCTVGIRTQSQGLRSLASMGALPPILSGLIRMPRRRAAAASAALVEHLATLSVEERQRALLELVTSQVAAVLGHESADAIDPGKAFQDLGFDSLAAVELRNRVAMTTGMTLQPTLVFDYPTSAALAEHLLGEVTASGGGKQVVVRAQASEEPIAIVGMACRYPDGISSPQGLWEFVAAGHDAVSEFPTDRGWDLDRLYHPDPENPGTSYAREGGFLEDAGGFDPEFFSISPREALVMDPQERLLLESCWEALEDAGIAPDALRKSQTGVFAGVAFNDYEPIAGGTISIVSGRVAYTLGLEGPAITVDTACSSSLVAMHLASQALRGGECTLALAGGVTVLSTPGTFIAFSTQRGLAPDGRCKPFAEAADGTGWGEGVGVLVLERLSDAERNGHAILATIKGSAVNQDGASNGLTAPNGPSQERVIMQALANAGVAPQEVDVVEAHGTGTTLGDPIEAGALLATYGQDREEPLKLGSIKSNIGHTQAAAGVAGVIKMTEAIRRGLLPKTLHVDRPSTKVDWESGEIELLTEPLEWEANGRPRRAGVSSFGVSGTNAHLILEEAPRVESGAEDGAETPALPAPFLLPLSAKTEPALAESAARLAAHFKASPALDPTDVAYSLLTTRNAFEHRAVALGSDREELLAALAALANRERSPLATTARARAEHEPVFLFPGQGAQTAGMALDLIDSSPAFATHMAECEEALAPHVDWSLEEVLRESGGDWLERLDIVQPALFATMVSLAKLWQRCGVRPTALVGHSQGEIAAAHIAGALSLEDAALIIAQRGKAMAGIAGRGGMLSVSLAVEQLSPYVEPLGERVSLAAVNGPASLVLSGDPEALDEVEESCERDGVRAQRIAVDYAAHSSQIEALRDGLIAAFAPISPQSTAIPLISTVSGERVKGEDLTPEYWFRNLRQTVLLEPVLRLLLEQGKRAFVEVGPHPVLAFGVQETIEDALDDPGAAILLSTLRRDEDSAGRFALSLAEAHARGVAVDWGAYFKGANAKRVPLPTYPFQRQHYWLTAGPSASGDLSAAGQSPADHPLLGAAVELAAGEGGGEGGLLLTGRISLSTHPWLVDHAVAGTVLLPGTAFLELALKAAERAGIETVEELTLLAPLVVPERGAIALQVSVSAPGEDERRRISIHARAEAANEEPGVAEWTLHAEGTLSPEPAAASEALEAWPPAAAEPLELESFYDGLAEVGLEYGPAFQGLTAAWSDGELVYAEVALMEEQATEAERFGIHPALLDSALHGSMLSAFGEGGEGVKLPFSWRDVSLTATGASKLRVRIAVDGEKFGLLIADEDGAPVASIGSLTARPLDTSGLRSAETELQGLSEIEWAQIPLGEDADGSAEVELQRCQVPGEPASALVARRAVENVLEIVQRWLADDSKAGTRLALITEGAMAPSEGEAPDPAAAAIWGFMRSVQAEHPGRFCLLDSDGSEASEAALPAALAAAALEPQLALREGAAMVPRLASVKAEFENGEVPLAIDPERTVLITGATGTLGALTARRLVARHSARHLLLVSRSGAAAEGAADLVRELEGLGAEVTVASCDVADRDALAALLASIPEAHPLGAVIHCAGALADATVEAMGAEQIERVFVPKADAAWNLHELTADADLSAFVLFSSTSGALGGPGQANYAAANVFLDALAEKRQAEGRPATSIAWGLWESQSSMTSHLGEADLARMRRGGIGMLSDEHGLALFEAALAAGRPAPLAVPFDRAGLRALAAGGALPPILSGLVRVPRRRRAASGSLAAKLAAMPAAERERYVIELVRAEAAFVLGHDSADAIESERPFRDLGFDSLGAVELRNRLGLAFELNLPATVIFDHPTAAELGVHLLAEMKGSDAESAPPRSMFAWLRQQNGGEQSAAALIDLIAQAATLRATFDAPLPAEELPGAELLADGPGSTKLVLLPSIMPTAGPAEYAQLAEQFRGERPVLALEAPGFKEGEAVPGSAPLALQTQVEAIQRLDLGSDFALVGHSSGGWFAQAAARQLEQAGTPPQAVLLMDTFFPPGGPLLGMRPEFLARWWLEQSVVPVDDARLTATMSYFRLFPEWRPPQIETPIATIVATDSLQDLQRSEPRDPPGSASNGAVEVPGDHFSMMATHAATTAQAIREAIGLQKTDPQTQEG